MDLSCARTMGDDGLVHLSAGADPGDVIDNDTGPSQQLIVGGVPHRGVWCWGSPGAVSTFDGSSAQEWAERVAHEVVRQLDPRTRLGGGGHFDANGAHLLRSWSVVEDGVPVLYLVYRHPWWGFATGLRRELDGEVLASRSGDRAVDARYGWWGRHRAKAPASGWSTAVLTS